MVEKKYCINSYAVQEQLAVLAVTKFQRLPGCYFKSHFCLPHGLWPHLRRLDNAIQSNPAQDFVGTKHTKTGNDKEVACMVTLLDICAASHIKRSSASNTHMLHPYKQQLSGNR